MVEDEEFTWVRPFWQQPTYGPWVLVNRLIISEGDDDRPMVQTRECLRDISTYGYHVTQGRRRVTDTFQH
jgi:hypothetical protein